MLLASDKQTAVIGFGVTGFSCGRYLQQKGRAFVGFDESDSDDLGRRFAAEFPGTPLLQGDLAARDLGEFDQIVLSPGVPLSTASIAAAKAAGVEIIGDIGLFMAEFTKPVLAVTGSNGKSTVVTWLAEVLAQSGISVGLAGNIGRSPLELLADGGDYEVVVLELSSFQLELIDRLNAHAGCVLNVSEDHLDRYPSMLAYHAAKQRVYRGAKVCVVNRDEALSQPLMASGTKQISYGLSEPDLNQYGLRWLDGKRFICRGFESLLDADELVIKGDHQLSNALAVLALAEAFGLDNKAILAPLVAFQGLPHRCRTVAVIDGVEFIDDSKATNTGATIAAVKGLARGKNIILLAGGLAKGADLSVLRSLKNEVKALVVFGDSAAILATIFAGDDITEVESMQAAVATAAAKAESGDRVLLSPACASLDMFRSYSDRGDQFAAAVHDWEASHEC